MTAHMSDRAERALAGALVLYQSESLADTILEAVAVDDLTSPVARVLSEARQ